jgi:hypothetical protein
MAEFIVMLTFICLTFFLLLFSALYKHMDGLTNDVERSNEMVGFIVHVATTKLPAIFFSAKPFELSTVARCPSCKRS